MCAGRNVIVTGAGRGIGRGEARALAAHGARVVVNDLGVALDGRRSGDSPADEVVKEICDGGGEAVANHDDISSWNGALRAIGCALRNFGALDAVVNNAGVIRDSMLVNMSPSAWDAVCRVHLRGTFCMTRLAAAHWRALTKKGTAVAGRVINTSSGAGLYGNVGQANYAAAKGGIASFTLTVAAELERYGVTVNAIAPGGRTRMTERVFAEAMTQDTDGFDAMEPANVAPLVVWLASSRSVGVTGQVFEMWGGRVARVEGWKPVATVEQDYRFNPEDFDDVVPSLMRAQGPVESPETSQ
jgi:NAD(P)-dependent dehydrogenase (short-subunit alcohol dehydrogenase family)